MDLRSALYLADGVCIAGRLLIEALAWRLDYLNRNAASASIFKTRRALLQMATNKLSRALARARASSDYGQLLEPLEAIVRESRVSYVLSRPAQLSVRLCVGCMRSVGPCTAADILSRAAGADKAGRRPGRGARGGEGMAPLGGVIADGAEPGRNDQGHAADRQVSQRGSGRRGGGVGGLCGKPLLSPVDARFLHGRCPGRPAGRLIWTLLRSSRRASCGDCQCVRWNLFLS